MCALPSFTVRRQFTEVKTQMHDILRYVPGVGFAETRKCCYRYIWAHHGTASMPRSWTKRGNPATKGKRQEAVNAQNG